MQIHCTLCQFGDLSNPAADGQPVHGMFAQVFQHAPGKIAHIQHRDIVQPVQRLHRPFTGCTCAAGDMAQPRRARHIDPAMNRGDPGRTAERAHHTGCTENRQSTLDPQPRVPSLQRDVFAARYRDLNRDIGFFSVTCSAFFNHALHHLTWHRIDRRLARRNWQARHGHRANPCTGAKHNVPFRGTDPRDHQRPMRDIRIIPGILGDADLGPFLARVAMRQREHRRLAPWQRDRNLARERPTPLPHQRRLGGGGGAGARGPTPAQFSDWFAAHGADYRQPRARRQSPNQRRFHTFPLRHCRP